MLLSSIVIVSPRASVCRAPAAHSVHLGLVVVDDVDDVVQSSRRVSHTDPSRAGATTSDAHHAGTVARGTSARVHEGPHRSTVARVHLLVFHHLRLRNRQASLAQGRVPRASEVVMMIMDCIPMPIEGFRSCVALSFSSMIVHAYFLIIERVGK